MSLLMVFIDGLGLGEDDNEKNPLVSASMPFFRGLLNDSPLTLPTVGRGIAGPGWFINPADALMGVFGLPQSATGQTVLLTGQNAAEICGRHISGFPTLTLKRLLNQDNIFKRLNRNGFNAVFANIYTDQYLNGLFDAKNKMSATTTAALAGECILLRVKDLLDGEGVYQDITNALLEERGYEISRLEPETAADNLIRLALKNDFTMFEYFQTDRCGHQQQMDTAKMVLNLLDRFLAAIVKRIAGTPLELLVVSDHGNIEDLSLKTHTFNPVPITFIGHTTENFQQIYSLLHIFPAILNYFHISGDGEEKDAMPLRSRF